MDRSHLSHSAKTATQRLAVLTEVDARRIAGGVGTVTLYLADDPDAQYYVVNVERGEGEWVATITASTRADALDAYLHPFARHDVPNIFSEAA